MTNAEDYRTKAAIVDAAAGAATYASASNATEIDVHASLEFVAVTSDENSAIAISADSTADLGKSIHLTLSNTDASSINYTFGTGFGTIPTIAVAAGKTKVCKFAHNGTAYQIEGTPLQID